MPKIVDHEKYRRSIVEKAAPVFSAHGFSGLGMRQIAQELGMSKSALYHYFPSKDELFAACTEFVVERDGALVETDMTDATAHEKTAVLMEMFGEIEKGFQGEAFLLLDYMRGKAHREIARDKNMKLANKRYLEMIAAIVGKADAAKVLTFMLGALMQRLFDGRRTRLSDIELWLRETLETHETPRTKRENT
jgi:AcrR family transcriptional regulator